MRIDNAHYEIDSEKEEWLGSALKKMSIEEIEKFGALAWKLMFEGKCWASDHRRVHEFSLNRIEKTFRMVTTLDTENGRKYLSNRSSETLGDYWFVVDKTELMFHVVKDEKKREELIRKWLKQKPNCYSETNVRTLYANTTMRLAMDEKD